jgi:hypothetical protein
MEKCSGHLAVEIVPGKQEKLRFQHLIDQESDSSVWRITVVQLIIMEQCCGTRSVEMIPGKHSDFST